MHHALNIQEIVDLICHHTYRTFRAGTVSIDGKSVVSLARTCRVLQSPALDILWGFQETIVNLLKCMPADLWELVDVGEGIQQMRPRRPIVSADWERPSIYMHRVKLFFCIGCKTIQLSEAFEALQRCLPGDCIFPNLSTLHWSNSADPLYIRLFLGPHIGSIAFSVRDDLSHLSFLSTLAQKHPALRDVSIYSDFSSHRQTRSISAMLLGLLHVEYINVPSLNLAALKHVGGLPTVKSLAVRNISFPKSFDQPMFCSLQILELRRAEIESTTAFINMWSDAPLESLRLHFSTVPTTGAMERLFTTLASRCSQASLWSLMLDSARLFVRDTDRAEYVYSLSSLFPFFNLTRVHIQSPVGFDLHDASILDMARAWPKIEELMLKSACQFSRPRVTLQGLRYLAQYCPELHSLQMAFDATRTSPWEARGRKRVVQENLEHLEVEYSMISKPLRVARFISGIFPNLRCIFTDREHEDNEGEDEIEMHGEAIEFHYYWKEVMELLPELCEIRKEERYWALHAEDS
ncbi:hypothetical protein B0H10DRAFT_2037589 [Mycena sp. CBHHK59/15]|nr:hypothetical protein B0H10DRAFT_2037589 [Mycena sp. CBHHK59/15]